MTGDLNRLIILQPLTVTRGTDGAEVKDYTKNNISVWAGYLARTGREFYYAQKVNAEVQAVFKIHRLTSVELDTSWRVKFGTHTFDILFVDDTNYLGSELTIACKEVV